MKTLLTFFFLLFSSFVFADDDLIDVKLLCEVDPENVKYFAFNFINSNEVKIYISNADDSIGEQVLKFKSFPRIIEINFPDHEFYYEKLKIDRRSLELEVHNKFFTIVSNGICNIIKGDDNLLFKSISELMTKQIKEIKKDNKI
ncbi:hypothetical protein OAQ96_02480 [Alphaproteobacteria bacterium]|nr:hypothetical protein [Alphaproteobacteria bacterium]